MGPTQPEPVACVAGRCCTQAVSKLVLRFSGWDPDIFFIGAPLTQKFHWQGSRRLSLSLASPACWLRAMAVACRAAFPLWAALPGWRALVSRGLGGLEGLIASHTGVNRMILGGLLGALTRVEVVRPAEIFSQWRDFLRPREFSVRLDVKMKRGAAPYPRNPNRKRPLPKVKGIIRKLIPN